MARRNRKQELPIMDPISHPIRRFDFDDKISGKASYCADVRHDGMLYARTLRSTRARARILSIHIPPLPEGYYTVDAADIPGRNVVPIVYDDQPFLARDVVNYIGEPILLVVGPEKEIILHIMSRIRVTYGELHPVLTIAEAEQTTDNFIFGDRPYFVSYHCGKGDISQAIAWATHVFEDEFSTGYQEHAYLEPQGFIAVYQDGRVTVSGSMQCPYYVREALVQALGWPEEQVRVVQLPTGGGFGGKEEYPSIPGVHAALAAVKTGRPVQLLFDRHEDMLCTTKRHPAVIRIKSYLDENNRIIGREIDVKTDAGAYAGLSSVVLQRMMFSSNGVYDVPHLKITGAAYATNNVVSGAFRGFGGPQAFFAIEMHMENIARSLNLDSVAFRRSHFQHRGDSSSTAGVFHYDIRLDEIAATLERISSYGGKRSRRPVEQAEKLRGVGCSFFYHGCGFTGSGEDLLIRARVRLKKYADDSVQIFVSSTEIGQGTLTTLRKIVARELGIPVQRVRYDYPDSDDCPNSGPTVASRTVMIVGKLLQDAATEMKKRWQEETFDVFRIFHFPDHLSWDNATFRGNAYPEYSWGGNVVEVEVDPVTGEIRVLGVWAVYDIGTPIDETIVQGQIEGGIVQGLAYGGLERLTVHNGSLQQTTLTDYLIPTALDVPRIESRLIDNPFEGGPFGARGLGELSLIGAAPALALAVQNAIGRDITELPITPERIREAMKRAN
jgi:CO/xanthine dehydrogenase Mo-binding subunit